MPVMRFETMRQILDQHAGVDGHVIHALLGLLFDDFEHDIGVQIFNPLHPRDGFVNRHGADGHGRVAQNGFANFVNVAAGGEIHDGVGAVVHRGMQLFQFFVNVRGHRGVADIGIDLAQRGHANAHRLEFGMIDVGGDDHAAARDFVANQFRRKLFAVGDVMHLLGDHALAGIVHLRKIAVGICCLAACNPFGARRSDAAPIVLVTVASVAGRTVRGGH